MATVVHLVNLPTSTHSCLLRESRPQPRTFAEFTVCPQPAFFARRIRRPVSGRGCQASIGEEHGPAGNWGPSRLHEVAPSLQPSGCYRGELVGRAGKSKWHASHKWVCSCSPKDGTEPQDTEQSLEMEKPGVKLALALLQFYKGEISPYLPGSCRYVPTCSVYAQESYKRYGVVKGTVLTLWRLARCNPLGGTGFDPPRWFDEERPPQV